MMEHKAFPFDYDSFSGELKPVLEAALRSGSSDGLVEFINSNRGRLKDPNEGEPLLGDWMQLMEGRDPHQFGDFALTKYYDPRDDRGLGADWQLLQEMLPNNFEESPILGFPLGPKENLFDPGKMGTYCQTALQVQRNAQNLSLLLESGNEVMRRAKEMLNSVQHMGRGLYVTF